MKRIIRLSWYVPVVAILVFGCSTQESLKNKSATDFQRSLTALSVPLDIQDYRVASAEGYRGVFFKLTRLPDAVEDRSESDPPRIVVDIKGPTGGEAPEQLLPGLDTLVSRVRIARYFGVLRVTLDLQGDDPPPYTVHRMADWVMIRIAPEAPGILESLTPPS